MYTVRTYCATVVIAAISLQVPALAQDDAIATSQGNAVIHPIGHASVLLTWNGKKILVDPAPAMGGGGRAPAAPGGGAPPAAPGGGAQAAGSGGARGGGGQMPAPSEEVLAGFKALGTPDLILIGHAHPDHFSVPILTAVAGPNTVLGVPQVVYDGLPDALKAKATIMANGDTSTLAGIAFRPFPPITRHPNGCAIIPKAWATGTS